MSEVKMFQKKIKAKTALIVEDSPTQAMHLHHLLSGHGLYIFLAHDGEEGLHYAKTHLPDIIVLDIELPAMNGIELCRLLKENNYTCTIPIILLTHIKHLETMKFGFQAGAIKYISKDEYADEALVDTLRTTGLID
jgi:DNA-binding response OmpR family regulator